MIQISNIKIRKDISDTKLFETIIKKYKKIYNKNILDFCNRKYIWVLCRNDIRSSIY